MCITKDQTWNECGGVGAQDGEPHQAHVQSTFQAYMRELKFRIDNTASEGINYHNYYDGLPLYIDKGDVPQDRFQQVINDLAIQCYGGHVYSHSLHARDVTINIDELQHYSCIPSVI